MAKDEATDAMRPGDTLGIGNGAGTLNFNGGSLAAQTFARGTGTAQFNWGAGTLHVGQFGTPSLPFNLSNTGSGVLDPGDASGVTNLFGNYVQGSAATLHINLGGVQATTQYDQLLVSGSAQLAGKLAVDLTAGFQPTAGNEFDILIDNGTTGTFQHLSLPTLSPGLTWQVDYAPRNVRLVGSCLESDALEARIRSFGLFGASPSLWSSNLMRYATSVPAVPR